MSESPESETPWFEQHRAGLWSIGYRMLGTPQDADDLVQDVLVRALQSGPADLEASPGPWLVRVATNLAIDKLRKRRSAPYVGVWLPAPVTTDKLEETHAKLSHELTSRMTPESQYRLRESVSWAMLVALEALTPMQRAVFVLREAFEFSAAETARLLPDCSPAAVRQLHARARRALDRYRAAEVAPDPAAHRRSLETLVAALATGSWQRVADVLAHDVVVLQDTDGRFKAARNRVCGRRDVARLLTGLAAKGSVGRYPHYAPWTQFEMIPVNHGAALYMSREAIEHGTGRGGHRSPPPASRCLMGVALSPAERIGGLYTVFTPEKLTPLRSPRPHQ